MAIRGGPDIIEDGLVLHLDAADKNSYPLSGDTWYDLSGNDNHVTLYNSPTYSSLNGGTLSFDGTNDYGFVNISSMYNTMTWCLWIYKGGTGRTIISDAVVNGFRGDIIFYSTTHRVMSQMYSYPQGYRNIMSDAATPLANGSLYSIIMTTDVNQGDQARKLYINGVQQTNTISIQSAAGTGSFWIGARGYAGPTAFFNGRISQLSVYNIALTADEVQQTYNATKGRYGL